MTSSALLAHPTGGYLFLPGIAPYSCGVTAAPGYEIIHATFDSWIPCRQGFEFIARFLAAESRPKSALCAIELRSPSPFSFAGFAEFNAGYAETLRQWGVFVDGLNPVARTNVAPELSPPTEPVFHAFSFTRPAENSVRPTFVVAGAGELPEGKLDRESIIALADTSSAGLQTKAEFVVGLMEHRLAGLNVDPQLVTAIDVYTIHPVDPLLADPLLNRLSAGRREGAHWHYTRPPIVDIEFEMDLRGVRHELRL